jgi:PAS domain S-box-containing protein
VSKRGDVSFLPLAVRALSEEEQSELVRALLQSTDYGVLVTDPQGNDLIANRRLGELFGLDPQQVVRLSSEEVRRGLLGKLHDPDGFVRRLEEIYRAPDLIVEDEVELVRPQQRILRRHTAPLKDASGATLGRIWTFLDITQTRRLQSDLERAAEALQAQVSQRTADLRQTTEVLQAMAQIVRAISSVPEISLLVAEIAARVRHLFGHSAGVVLLREPDGSALVGAAATVLPEPAVRRIRLAPEDDPLLWETLAAADPAEPRLQVFPETPPAVVGALGCRVACMVPLAVGGRVAGALLLGAGYTAERPRAQGAGDGRAPLPDPANPFLQEHIEAVAGLVALAIETHGLQAELQRAYRELRDAQDRLVEAEKLGMAGVLATSVAHDIRNIITPLNVELELLTEAPNEALVVAREQVSRLAALTQRLLAFSRHTHIQPTPMPVSAVFERLKPLLVSQAELERVEVRFENRVGGAMIPADVARLEQLFLNLAFNAFQAMAPTGGVLTITADREGDRLALRFQDTGSGIPPEHLPRLFQPFFSTKPSGTGLGLFSCRHIAVDHGGDVEAANVPGGACFTVRLPIVE